MIERIKEWVKKSKEQSYKHYLESELELDADFYQGEYSAFIKVTTFLNEIEEQYKDDFK